MARTSHGALAPGDVFILGFNADGDDSFSFITLVDIPDASEVLYFTDNGVTNGVLADNEGTLCYTPPGSGLASGTVVVVTNVNASGVPGADEGTILEIDNISFTTSGDQLIVYQTNGSSTNFVFALSTDSTDWSTRKDNTSSEVPPGLTESINAIHTKADFGANADIDCGRYTNGLLGTAEGLKLLFQNGNNWQLTDSGPLALSSTDAVVLGAPPPLIAFQGFEGSAEDTWTVLSNANASAETGASDDTPAGQRIRTGNFSHQTGDSNLVLDLDEVSIVNYTSVILTVHLSSASIRNNNGADGGDRVSLFTALNGAPFPLTADLVVTGPTNSSNARWSYSGVSVTTTAGVPVTVRPAGGGNRDDDNDGYSTLNVHIPDSANRVRLRIDTLNNFSNEVWNVDDIMLDGVALPKGFVFMAH